MVSAFQFLHVHPYLNVSSKVLNASKSLLACLVARSLNPSMRFASSLQRLGMALQARCWSYAYRFKSLCLCVLLLMSCRVFGATTFTTTMVMFVGLCPNIISYACLALFACYSIAISIRNRCYNSKASFRTGSCSEPNRLFDALKFQETCKKNSSESKPCTRLHLMHYQQ